MASNAPDRDKPEFKYTVEHAITVSCDWAGIVAPAQLEAVSKDRDLPACNIYLIGRRPRITINRDSWSCDAENLTFEVHADLGDGESIDVLLQGSNPFGLPVELVSEPPHTVVELRDEEGYLVAGSATALWVSMYLQAMMGPLGRSQAVELDEAVLDLDVVYVGQSQDAGGAAERRLLNHSTLQKVMAETAQNAPHLDVWVILMRFATYNTLGQFGGWLGTAGNAASAEHLSAVSRTELSDAELTALAEAALIRYFQPEYNQKFKDHFPEPLHRTYRTIYDLDFNAVGIDFDTLYTIGLRLGSPAVKPTFIHAGLFSMHNENERRRFFDIDGWSDSVVDATHLKRDRG